MYQEINFHSIFFLYSKIYFYLKGKCHYGKKSVAEIKERSKSKQAPN